MEKIPLLSANELIKIVTRMGFERIRQRGSHSFFRHKDGRTTVIAIHSGEKIDRRLLNKIIKKDLQLNREEFEKYL